MKKKGKNNGQMKMDKLQFVQYECIKSELKEEYEKKIISLKNKFNRKAIRDPSLLLLTQISNSDPKNTIKTKDN